MRRNEGYHRQRGPWRPNQRQRQVLDALVEGKTNAEIAQRLGITVDGAKWHVGELLAQTGLADRQALARWWREEKQIPRRHGFFPLPALLKPAAAAGLTLGALLLGWLVFTGSDGEDATAPGLDDAPVFADVGVEATPRPQDDPPDPTACPEDGSDLRTVDRGELEAQGFVYVNQAFSGQTCAVLAANRPGASFVRVSSSASVVIGEGSRPLLLGGAFKTRREVSLGQARLEVAVTGSTRYAGPGREVAITAHDEQGRVYRPAVDAEGGLWIHPEPLPPTAVLNYWTGELLDTAGARRLAGRPMEGLSLFTSCYQPMEDEPCGVNYHPLNRQLRAPVAGRLSCLAQQERRTWTSVDEAVAGIELDAGEFILRFERLHTGGGAARPEDCRARQVQAGDLIGGHYHYWIGVYARDGSRLAAGVALDGTLVVGDFKPARDCPCIQGR